LLVPSLKNRPSVFFDFEAVLRRRMQPSWAPTTPPGIGGNNQGFHGLLPPRRQFQVPS
jgi:hypothetical protein